MKQATEPKKLSLKANFLFNLIIQLVTYIIPLITAPYLSRVLSPEGIGQNSFANSICSYFTMVIAFGFLTYGTKAISEKKDRKKEYSIVFWNIFFSRGLLFVFCFIIYFLMAYLWGFGSVVDKNIFLIYSLVLVNSFLTIDYLFQGLENFRILSLLNIGCNILAAIGYFLFVKESSDLLIYITIFVTKNLLISALSWLFAFKRLDRPHFKEIHVFSSLKDNLFYFLPTIAISIYTVLDRTMLGYLSTTSEVGYYEEAYKIISLVTGLMNAISPVMLSRVSALVKEGKEKEAEDKIVKMGEVYFLLGFPILLGLYAVSRYFIPAFFGEAYLPSVAVIYWLIPLVMIIPISNQIGNVYFVVRGKVGMTTWFFLAGALLNFSTNFLSIPYLGAAGAAITSLAAETLISALFLIFSWKHIPYRKIVLQGWKPLVAAFIMFLSVVLLDRFLFDSILNSLIIKTLCSVGCGVLIYGIVILLLKEPMVMTAISKFRAAATKFKGEGRRNE